MNVRMTVSTRNSTHSAPNTIIWANARSRSRIIATLTRLFAVRMVARSRSESERSAEALRYRGESDSEICLSSSGESEKNDVSDAETKPERTKRSRAVTIAMTDPAVGAQNETAQLTDVPVIKKIPVSIITQFFVQNGIPLPSFPGCSGAGTGPCWDSCLGCLEESISIVSTKISVT